MNTQTKSLEWFGPIVCDDGEEWFADGAPNNALHAFIFDGKDGYPVVWKVSDLRVNPSDIGYEMDDEILFEGSHSTIEGVKAEVEAIIALALLDNSRSEA